ncbi:retinitis pigmentosa 9 protein-like isoform X1 [Pan paniscus]|uniref:retinitis pigmentosa 9 protein-like isoform X1 n=1 Tax=Pan paniscus TaxID=9597 RepID=UPI001560E143|nr:retinitis pigmentosa 9 protein-like isoform X1 [Pan paniscus]
MRGLGARGGRGSCRIRSCSGPGSRSGGGTTPSSCSSSSTWSPWTRTRVLQCWCGEAGKKREWAAGTGHGAASYEKPPPGLIKAHEDFMYDIIRDNKQHEKNVRIQQLKQLLEDSTSDEDRSSSSSSEGKEKHKKKKKKEKHKKRKKEKKKKKKRKHKSSKSNEGSDSE